MNLVVGVTSAMALVCATSASVVPGDTRPNVIVILADDLGVGDLNSYSPSGMTHTPAFDALAAEGLRFTDAHSPSSVCSPTRYDGMFAIRRGRWKLVDGLGSGGFTAPKRVKPKEGEASGQLYDLAADPEEPTNLYASEPAVVDALSRELARLLEADG